MMPTRIDPTSPSAMVHQMTRSTMTTGVTGGLGRRLVAASVTGLVYACLALGSTRAAEPDRKVRLDLVRGPLTTSSRITGLGGAYAGVAVGIDGVWRNPATLANRPDYSTDWFDYDLTLDWFINSADTVDIDGDGLVASNDYDSITINVGASLQFGNFAVGILVAAYGFGDGEGAAQAPDEVSYVDTLLDTAYAFDGGQWIFGAGVLISTLDLKSVNVTAGQEVSLVGAALDLGFLHRPRAKDWRIGGRIRLGAELGLNDEAAPEGATPLEAAIPWQIGFGASRMFAADRARRYNPRLRSRIAPVRDHRYLLLSAELVAVGETNGQSLEALIAGVTRQSGLHPTMSVHIGGEGELFDNRVRARFGSYFEPNRVADGLAGRLHLTGGIEVRLFEAIVMWKATFGFDIAPGWENITVGVGFWK